MFCYSFIQKIFTEHVLCAPNCARHWVCLRRGPDLTVLWVTKQEREQEEAVVAAAPSLVHTGFDHHDVGTQYVLNKMPVCELSQTATSL